MEPKFTPSLVEEKIFNFWLEKGFFKPEINKAKKPFSIILPPPNANGFLHLGHAMYIYEDIMIRYHKIKGDVAYWQPGTDHAGIETQFVFEKELKKQGKSRFDFSREELFQMIWDFVEKNKGNIKKQFNKLGFSLDWSYEVYPLDKKVIEIVYQTFSKLFEAGLVYRGKRLVNYCTRCGTSFSDLEVEYKEETAPLYYLKYGPFVLATTRPETKFGDTGLAIHPNDKRYQKFIGQEIEAEGLMGTFKIKVVADEAVDPKFGTGVVKVTPAHDFTDFEIGKRHNLQLKQVIGYDGKLNELAGKYQGLRIKKAREIIVQDLKTAGLLVKIKEDYQHRIGVCYKCGTVIEPLPLEQWFIKIKPLADQAKKLVEKNEIKIYPKRFKKQLIQILDNFYDWNISRQIVWGIRIPAYKCQKMSNVKCQMSNGWFISLEKPNKCLNCGSSEFEQDKDTFDTWFSSGQWPFATLMSCSLFEYFYPTTVMETGYDILRAWVARMIMIGYFVTGKVPFKNVFLHGMVRDKHGAKMSKSKGNVIDPIIMVDKYGADALRSALIFGVQEGKDLVLTEEKIIGMRNFANKIWNIGRFIFMNLQVKSQKSKVKSDNPKLKIIEELEKEFGEIEKQYHKDMKNYRFSKAFDLVYHFLWHRLADFYIEELKEEIRNGKIEVLENLKQIYFGCLVMIHPYMPFITEAVWKVFNGNNSSILQINELTD